MIAPAQIRKPENWQDFEKLCKKLWGEIWSCPDTIKRNGRSGQNQCGIDIYGIPKNEIQYYGIQCKGKDDYIKSQLTKSEVDEEIIKAYNFKPTLKRMIFATTANKDVNIEEYIRLKNTEHIKLGLFEIDICSWEDIVDLLEERRSTYNWYINNCQYKDSSDIDVMTNWDKKFTINPQYIKTTKVYHKKIEIPNIALELNKIRQFSQPCKLNVNSDYGLNAFLGKQKKKIDYRWCTVPFNIKNTGTTVIENYKVYLIFDDKGIERIDDKFRYFNPGPLYNQNIIAQENIDRENKREVFESSEYKNVIEIVPLNQTLVQTESKTFKIGVKPKDDINEIKVHWEIKSRNFQKKGELIIEVVPTIEEKREYISIEMESDENIIKTEVIIEPKIIEE